MKRLGFQWLARGACRHPQAMTIQGGSLCSTEFPAMVGVIRHPEVGVLLFDTGYDRAFLEATRPFPERLYRWATPVELGDGAQPLTDWLAGHGAPAGDIAGVILSHFHGDHVAGLNGLPSVPIYCAAAGLERVRRGSRLRRVTQGLLAGLVPADIDARTRFFEDAARIALPSAFAPLEDGRDILGDGSLIAVELPGHCPGHWGLAFRDEHDRHVLLAADAAWSLGAIDQCRPPPRLTTALLGETARYRQTLSQLHHARRNNPALAILPSHCVRAGSTYAGDAD